MPQRFFHTLVVKYLKILLFALITYVMEREARVELVYFCLEGRRVTKNTSPAFLLVVVEGIDPSSRAYEARAHPSTPHNLMLGYSMEFESMLTESQSVVLTADTNYTI